MYFRYFIVISPWKKVGHFIWKKMSPHHPRMYGAKFGWNWPNGSGEEVFFLLFRQCFFRYFVIISPWKRTGFFIWINLNTLHPKMLCSKFGWNSPSGSGEDNFLNFVKVFLLFRNHLPLEKGWDLQFNKFNPFHQRMHCAKFG